MDSQEEAQNNALPLLRDKTRHRFLEEMLRKVVENGVLQPTVETPKLEGIERRYVVLIVDAITLRMLTAVCKIPDLLSKGVCMVELIDNVRHATPILEAIYFISPTEANVRQLVEDAAGEKKRANYKSFHVFFTHKISNDLMSLIASSRDAVLHISSLAEANLGFVTHDSRIFHFTDSATFSGLFEGDGSCIDVSNAAERLATLLASIGILQPKIRVQTRSANVAARLGSVLKTRLAEIESKGPLFKQEHEAPGPHMLVIVERGYDWPVMLAHDFHHEAAVYDLLGGSSISVEDGVFIQTGPKEKRYALGEDDDALWQSYRHVPIWQVNDWVVQEMAKWNRQEKDLQDKTAAATSSSKEMGSMATNVMNALQSLPSHKERLAKLQVHSDMSLAVCKHLDDDLLVAVGSFEQELMTGVDELGRDLVPRKIEKELGEYLTNPDIPNVVKQRLLMLFLASDNDLEETGRKDKEKIAGFARKLAKDERKVAISEMWLGRCGVAPETNEQAVRKREFYRKRIKGIEDDLAKKLARWQPKARRIMEQAATNSLSTQEFPELGSESDQPRKTSPSAPAAGTVVLFVLGGLTMTEARQAHEVSKSLGVEVFAGGDCIVTARTLLDELKRRVVEGDDAAGAEGVGFASDVREGVEAAFHDMQDKAQEAKDNASAGLAFGGLAARFGFR